MFAIHHTGGLLHVLGVVLMATECTTCKMLAKLREIASFEFGYASHGGMCGCAEESEAVLLDACPACAMREFVENFAGDCAFAHLEENRRQQLCKGRCYPCRARALLGENAP